MPIGTPSVSWLHSGRVSACHAARPWCRGVTKLTGCAWGRDGALLRAPCRCTGVSWGSSCGALMLCSGARVTSCGAASLGVSLRWCLVRGLLRRSCVTALGCDGGGLVRSCVAGCAGDGAGVWGRRELGSGAPATLSGLRRGSCVAGGRTLSRGWYVAGGGPWSSRGIVAGGGPWCRRGAERRRGNVRISRDKKRGARRRGVGHRRCSL